MRPACLYYFFFVVRRAVVFFAVPLRLAAERDLLVPDVDRALLVPEVERDRVVPEVERALLAPDVDRDFAAVARPPLLPAARFCAVVPPRFEVERGVPVERDLLVPDVDRALLVPEVERDLLVPEVERDLLVPEVDRARDVVERELVDRDLAAVAFPPLRPAAFFCAVVPPRLEVERARDVPVEPLRLVVERDVLRDVPVFARDPERLVPDVDRERVPLVDRRGDAARTRETASSVSIPSATDSAPERSGIKPGLLTLWGGMLCCSASRLSPSK